MNARYLATRVVGLLLGLQAGGCMDPVEARAGADRTVGPGATVTLDGARSLPRDPKRMDFSWEVVEGPAVTIADPKAVTTTFSAPRQRSESRIIVRLTVTYVDLGGQLVPSNSDADEVLIRVRADRDALDTQEATEPDNSDTAEPTDGQTAVGDEALDNANADTEPTGEADPEPATDEAISTDGG